MIPRPAMQLLTGAAAVGASEAKAQRGAEQPNGVVVGARAPQPDDIQPERRGRVPLDERERQHVRPHSTHPPHLPRPAPQRPALACTAVRRGTHHGVCPHTHALKHARVPPDDRAVPDGDVAGQARA